MVDFQDSDVLQEYLELALHKCQGVTKKSSNKWNLRCPICGDSAKSLKKRRGHLFKNQKGIWVYFCFNECGGMGASKWLKVLFPDIYRDYIKRILQGKSSPTYYKPKQETKVIEEKKEPTKKQYPFFKITDRDVPIIKDAIKYCEDRKIPRDVYLGFYVCEEGDYQGRMIIPFFNRESKIYYFIGRSLYNQQPKYLLPCSEKQIYNIHNIDTKKPVIFLEGPLDSLFCENSIAIAGLKMSESQKEQIKDLDIHYLLDSDSSGRKKALEFLREGKSVFIWKKFLKDYGLEDRSKYDLNEVYILLDRKEKFTFEELKKYFTTNYLNAVYLK